MNINEFAHATYLRPMNYFLDETLRERQSQRETETKKDRKRKTKGRERKRKREKDRQIDRQRLKKMRETRKRWTREVKEGELRNENIVYMYNSPIHQFYASYKTIT